MTPTLSKELQERIEREAEDYGKYGTSISPHIAYRAGATAYAHYKELFEQAKKALERLKSNAEAYSYVLDLPMKHLLSIINEALASWKEEGKEGDPYSAEEHTHGIL